MSNWINWQSWNEAGEAQPPTGDPYAANVMATAGDPASPEPHAPDQPQDQSQNQKGYYDADDDDDQNDQDDVTQDPQEIEEPQQGQAKDFEVWRHEFFELAKKGDTGQMIDAIGVVRDRPGLGAPQKKFVEDNLQIWMYRQDIEQQADQIRKLVNKDFDITNPGTTLMQHICAVMEENTAMIQVPIKLTGTFAWKSDIHRKWVAALLGAVQEGGGASRHDLVLNDDEWSVEISTRFYAEFGEIDMGKWSLAVNDAEKFLSQSEFKALEDGSPGYKRELRRKIVISSIAERFARRAFLIHVCHTDGTLYSIGWDAGDCIKAAYRAGKLEVRAKGTKDKDCKIAKDGAITPLEETRIFYVKDTGELDENGNISTIEVPFIEERSGKLYVIADGNTLRDAASNMSGLFFRELPYSGNPTDI